MKRFPPAARAATLALAGLLTLVLWPGDRDHGDLIQDARDRRDEIHGLIDEMLAKGLGSMQRDNGFVYAVDLGQLLAYAAKAKKLEWYEPLRELAFQGLVVDDPEDSFTKGFVLWRFRPGDGPEDRDATGTTEALRLAEALWEGAESFGRESDRQWAIEILRGYARHESYDQDIWLIRNYYNLRTKAFATNSFLIDLDPDFVARVAKATGDADLQRIADYSAESIRSARTPAGLLHSMIQPEVLTLAVEPGAFFSPNDIEQLSNVLANAERSVETNREIAQGVLDFAVRKFPDGKLFFDATTGRAVRKAIAGGEAWGPMTRLAAKLGEKEACAKALGRLLDKTPNLRQLDDVQLYIAGETLLALHDALGLLEE